MAKYFTSTVVWRQHLLLILLLGICGSSVTIPDSSSQSTNSTKNVVIKNVKPADTMNTKKNLEFIDTIKGNCSHFEPDVVLTMCKDSETAVCELALELLSFACRKYPASVVRNVEKVDITNGSLCEELEKLASQGMMPALLVIVPKQKREKVATMDCKTTCLENPELCHNTLHTIELVKRFHFSFLTSSQSTSSSQTILNLVSQTSAAEISPESVSLTSQTGYTLAVQKSTQESSNNPSNSLSNTVSASQDPKIGTSSTPEPDGPEVAGVSLTVPSSPVLNLKDKVSISSETSNFPVSLDPNVELSLDDLDEDGFEQPLPALPSEDDENRGMAEDKEDFKEQAMDAYDDLDQLPDLNPKPNEAAATGRLPTDELQEQNDQETRLKTVTYSTVGEAEDTHFFVYFLVVLVLTVLGYLAFHNKQKILALCLEGRRRRVAPTRNGRSAAYRKLDSNLEEVMTSSRKTGTSNIIY